MSNVRAGGMVFSVDEETRPVVGFQKRGILRDSRLEGDLYLPGSYTCSQIGRKDPGSANLIYPGHLQAIRRKQCQRSTSSWLQLVTCLVPIKHVAVVREGTFRFPRCFSNRVFFPFYEVLISSASLLMLLNSLHVVHFLSFMI